MRKLSAVGATLVVFLLACSSSLTGNEGNFQFSYAADDRVTDFNKPIAVGARLDIEVRDVGAQLPVELLSATTDDAGVLSVVSFADHRITLAGVGEGSGLLSVEGTTATGETLTDSVNMLAAVPEVHILAHTCTAGDEAAYLAAQRIWVPFEFERSNGQPIIGYGYYPVTFSDGGAAASLNESDSGQVYMALDTSTAGGTTELVSDIDGSWLGLHILTPDQIDGVMEPVAFVLEDIDVGDINAFYALPKAGGLTICQADTEFEVQSDTPDICDVRKSDQYDLNAYEYGWFEVEGIAQGTCSYTVTYPEGSGGQGTSQQFSFEIQP